MPSAALPPDRAAVEAVLSAAQVAALRRQCERLGIRQDRWHKVAALSRVWGQEAALTLAARLVERDGLSEGDARTAAAVALGLEPDTVASRAYRWPLDAFS